MKKIIYLFIMIGSGLLPISYHIQGMTENGHFGNTYQGRVISPETIKDIADQYTPMPPQTKDAFANWFEGNAYNIKVSNRVNVSVSNAQALALLIGFPNPPGVFSAKLQANMQIINELRKKYRFHKTGERGENIIFEPVPGKVVHMAGLANRVRSYISGQGEDPFAGKWIDPWSQEGTILLKNPNLMNVFPMIPTYQTISRYANYLLAKKIVEENNLTYVKIPDSYLLHVLGRPERVDDENYVVVQDKITEPLTEISDKPEKWQQLPNQAIQDLAKIALVGLWNISGNLMVNNNNQFVLVDWEHPNNNVPQRFLNRGPKGKEDYHRYVNDGINMITGFLEKSYKSCSMQAENPVMVEARGRIEKGEYEAVIDTLMDKRTAWIKALGSEDRVAQLTEKVIEKKQEEALAMLAPAISCSGIVDKIAIWKKTIEEEKKKLQ